MSLTANSISYSYRPAYVDNILYSKHVDQMVWTCSMYKNECIHHFDGKPVGKSPLGINKTRRENNFKMGFKEIRSKDVDWICLAIFYAVTPSSGPWPPCYRGFKVTLRHTTLGRTSLERWSAHRRDLYLTTHNRQKDRHPCSGGIRTRNPSNIAAAYPLLRTHTSEIGSCGQWKGQ